MATRTRIVNFLLFQLGWFACVLGAAAMQPWAGVALALAIVGFHLLRTPHRQTEAALILVATLTGTLWDSLLVAYGWLHYPSGMIGPALAPVWIIALWALFATTLNVSLRWLRPRPVLAALCGAIGGPLAFYAGLRLGAVEIPDLPATLALLAAGWAMLTPLLLLSARRLDGFAATAAMARAA